MQREILPLTEFHIQQVLPENLLQLYLTHVKVFENDDCLCLRASLISLNPMDYLDKVIITYPNLLAPMSSNPYLTSIYVTDRLR